MKFRQNLLVMCDGKIQWPQGDRNDYFKMQAA